MTQKSFSLMLTVVLLIFFTLSVNNYARVVANGTETAFDGSDQPDSSASFGRSSAIGTLIIEGAGYFLESQSEAALLLNRFEMSDLYGIDYTALGESVNKAIEGMQKANDSYAHLVLRASNTPYRQEVINRLKAFDYKAFQQREGLIKSIMDQTSAYLKTGDICGLYGKILGNTGEILEMLTVLKSDIDAQRFPSTNGMWRLNQKYAQSMLFGQYAAEVFGEIR